VFDLISITLADYLALKISESSRVDNRRFYNFPLNSYRSS